VIRIARFDLNIFRDLEGNDGHIEGFSRGNWMRKANIRRSTRILSELVGETSAEQGWARLGILLFSRQMIESEETADFNGFDSFHNYELNYVNRSTQSFNSLFLMRLCEGFEIEIENRLAGRKIPISSTKWQSSLTTAYRSPLFHCPPITNVHSSSRVYSALYWRSESRKIKSDLSNPQ
jgi:hypothetical protein